MKRWRTRLERVARGPVWLLPLVIGVVVIFLPSLVDSYYIVNQVALSLILALVVSGLNLSFGYAGELALGQTAIFAGGAYAAAILSSRGHTEVLVHLGISMIFALAIGVVIGAPALRLNRTALAMTSFFLVLLIPDVIRIFEKYTGGANGLSIPSPTLFGRSISPDAYFGGIVIVTILWFAAIRNLVVSRHGVAILVLKQSPVLASSIGVSVFRMRLLAFAVGAVPAGLAGALFADLYQFVSPDTFSFTLSITILAASILGGSQSVYGAVVGALALQFGLNASGSFSHYSGLATGAFLIAGGVLVPGGLASVSQKLWQKVLPRVADSARPAEFSSGTVPPLPGRLLEVRDVGKTFGGNRALAGVSLTAEPGRVTALIGPNGSGKTTMLNMICGFYRTDSGMIKLGEQSLSKLSAFRVARAGVTRTFQTPNIPKGVSVLEAVTAGRYTRRYVGMLETVLRLPRFFRVRRADRVAAIAALDMVGLRHCQDREATSLPLGQRRLLEVARCLIAEPGVVLLDEVASGLDEHEIQRLDEVVRSIAAAGGTVVLVEHNFQLVLRLADVVVALAHGQMMACGTPDEIASNSRVQSEYLGVEHDESSSKSSNAAAAFAPAIGSGNQQTSESRVEG